MTHPSPAQVYAAETLGTAILLATVVGSGIMAENLAGGNVAIALLGNTIPTGAILVVVITIFGPISGAHFNPAVSLAMGLAGRMPWARLIPFAVCQIIGAIIGVWIAHAMFDLSVFQFSTKMRWGTGQWIVKPSQLLACSLRSLVGFVIILMPFQLRWVSTLQQPIGLLLQLPLPTRR